MSHNYNTAYLSTEAFRFELANSGAVQALVDCLSFADTRVQSSAMQALGMLSCDCIARQLLLECNGVPPLLTCLQSPSGELVQRTAWTIAIAAQSSQVATAIGQLGYVICVEVDLHNVVITFTEIIYHWSLLKSASIYMYML